MFSRIIVILVICLFHLPSLAAYPIDGFYLSGIKRIVRLQQIIEGVIEDKMPIRGALLSVDSIRLQLVNVNVTLGNEPVRDAAFQKRIDQFFAGLDPAYSIALVDFTDPHNIKYAGRKEHLGYQPGSVGKLAVVSALFCELENLYPDDFEKRRELLKAKIVRAGKWAMTDEHTVPFYTIETKKLVKRQVKESDEFSLFEWADHMLSVSNNGAASVVWREAILMRVFGHQYEQLEQSRIDSFFTQTSKKRLSELAVDVVNYPLSTLDISSDEWRLGQMFTRGATSYIPGKDGSKGTPAGLIKWLIALEQGKIVDEQSSLEIKRLLYMTDRRIRYASSPVLNDAAVYFKSGSLYKCNRELNPDCGKYQGNVENFMNSVIIVEHPDGFKYMVVLMSNVLGKNSNADHRELGGKIDRLVRGVG